ncbi:MAG: NAD-dependent protein deacylase [Candidatus Parabeggiatoa sp. nov. 2]|nr:MAG: NAD-dependent protein deacylase [Beggiatoa sp. 4572_84]RKZ60545.1 MAG: NAD-dependent protein deacylase [Gammaproteobacteria bacterium]
MNDNVIPAELVEELRTAQRVVVLTGAGTSAESGVPTFRDAQTGLWARYDPTELATPEAFRRNPRLVWEWYTWRRELVAKAAPNPGHLALVQMQARVPELTLITQNIDGLHQRAGSQQIIELHGNLARTKCADNGYLVESWPPTEEVPPHCPRCGGLLRPDVVWFGEPLSKKTLLQAITAVRQCDLVFSVGTSSLVHPAASLPFEALEQGAKLVEINPDETPLTPHVHFVLYGKAGEILPTLVDLTWPQQKR